MVHDYHLYTLPDLVRRARPDAFLHHFVHIPWTQSDAWRVLPAQIREEIFTGLLANDIIGFHTRSYQRNFLQCCRDLMDLEVDFDGGLVRFGDREVWVRAYPLPIDHRATKLVAQSARVEAFEEELLRRRRHAGHGGKRARKRWKAAQFLEGNCRLFAKGRTDSSTLGEK